MDDEARFAAKNTHGGLATVIDDAATLVALCRMLDGTSTGMAAARRRCEELVALCASRGYRRS